MPLSLMKTAVFFIWAVALTLLLFLTLWEPLVRLQLWLVVTLNYHWIRLLLTIIVAFCWGIHIGLRRSRREVPEP